MSGEPAARVIGYHRGPLQATRRLRFGLWLGALLLAWLACVLPAGAATPQEVMRDLAAADGAEARADYPAALAHTERALAMSRELLGQDHPGLAQLIERIGNLCQLLADWSRARDCHEQALAIRLRALGDRHPEVGYSLNNLGLVCEELGDDAGALDYFRRAESVLAAARGARHPDVALALGNQADVLNRLGEYPRALELYREALAIRRAAFGDTHSDVAMTLNNMGLACQAVGDYPGAEEALTRALAIQRALHGDRHPVVAAASHNLGILDLERGRHAAALAACRQALAISTAIFGDTHPDVADIHTDLGRVHLVRGDFAEAEEHFTRALAVGRAVYGDTHPALASALQNLALVRAERGDNGRALADLEQALALKVGRLGERHPEVGAIHNDLGLCLVANGEPGRAREHYSRALRIFTETLGETHQMVGTVCSNLAAVLLPDDPAGARARLEQSLAIRRAAFGDRHPDVALSRYNLGMFLLEGGDTPAGIAELQAAAAALQLSPGAWNGRASSLRRLPLTVLILYRLSRAEATDPRLPPRERLRRALATAREALAAFSGLRTAVSAGGRAHWEETFSDLPGWVLHLECERERLGETADPGLALRAVEMASAWSFLELLATARVDASGALPEGLADTERELLSRLARLDAGAGGPELEREHEAVVREFDAFVGRLEREQPRYAAFRYPRPAELDRARGALAPGELALAYAVSDFGWFLVALGPDTAGVFALGSAETGAARLAAARAAIERPRLSEPGNDRGRPFRELYDFLVGPAAALLEGKKLVVVPAGALEAVSFAALLQPDGRYLGDSRALTYAPSLAILALQRERRPELPPARLLAVGNPAYGTAPDPAAAATARRYSDVERAGWAPLPGTAREISAVAAEFPEAERRLLLDRDASESRVRGEDGRRYGYFHFACHGALEAGPGREPALVLAQAGNRPPDDGFLTLSEVAARPLRARLAVLSACNTGRSGGTAPRTGISSLARAFLLAGSDAVVVSLWSVADAATARLMTELYRGLRAGGLAPGPALQRAVESVRTDPAHPTWSHPAYWAPFIVIGD